MTKANYILPYLKDMPKDSTLVIPTKYPKRRDRWRFEISIHTTARRYFKDKKFYTCDLQDCAGGIRVWRYC